MNIKKKEILTSIFVICIYFLCPYILNIVDNLLKLSDNGILYLNFCFNFVFLFLIIYIYRKRIKNYFSYLNKEFKKHLILSIKIFFVGLFLYVLFNALFKVVGINIPNNTLSLNEILKKIPVIFILNTLFYYPVVEELIFKMSFKDIFKNKWSFIIITGVFNALFQIVFSFNNLTDLLYLLPYSVFFASLSYIYYKTDNILYPIFLRMCYNLIPCIICMVDLLQ